MVDDLVAGVLAALVLRVILWLNGSIPHILFLSE